MKGKNVNNNKQNFDCNPKINVNPKILVRNINQNSRGPLFEMIVFFEPGVNMEDFINARNITVLKIYNNLKAVLFLGTNDDFLFYRNSNAVSCIDLNILVNIPDNEEHLHLPTPRINREVSESLERIGGGYWKENPEGVRNVSQLQNVNPVNTYVFDTGVGPHPELNIDPLRSRNFTSSDSSAYFDDNGHGTLVSGVLGSITNDRLILGVAPDINIVSIKVLKTDGTGMISDILCGIDYVMGLGDNSAVVNFSFGGVGTNKALEEGVIRFLNFGAVVVCAAGNFSQNVDVFTPANISRGNQKVITVGAYNSLINNFASFSDFGNKIDILAPGVDVKTLDLDDVNSLILATGTSLSAPFVTGVAALIRTLNPNLTNNQVRSQIVSQAQNANLVGDNPLISGVPANTTNLSVWAGTAIQNLLDTQP